MHSVDMGLLFFRHNLLAAKFLRWYGTTAELDAFVRILIVADCLPQQPGVTPGTLRGGQQQIPLLSMIAARSVPQQPGVTPGTLRGEQQQVPPLSVIEAHCVPQQPGVTPGALRGEQQR